MSYSFYVAGTQYRGEGRCDGCSEADDPSCAPCPYCHGTRKLQDVLFFEVEPLNLSNDNARAMLQLLEADTEQQGEWSADQLPEIRRRIIRLQNQAQKRAAAEVETVEEYTKPGWVDEEGVSHIDKRLRFWSGGRSDAYILGRLSDLLALVMEAQARGSYIYWG